MVRASSHHAPPRALGILYLVDGQRKQNKQNIPGTHGSERWSRTQLLLLRLRLFELGLFRRRLGCKGPQSSSFYPYQSRMSTLAAYSPIV